MANTAEIKFPEMTENFEELLNEQFGENGIVGTVMKGTVIRLTDDFATVDVGLKSEGRIPLREFGKNNELKIGDVVEIKYGEKIIKFKITSIDAVVRKAEVAGMVEFFEDSDRDDSEEE